MYWTNFLTLKIGKTENKISIGFGHEYPLSFPYWRSKLRATHYILAFEQWNCRMTRIRQNNYASQKEEDVCLKIQLFFNTKTKRVSKEVTTLKVTDQCIRLTAPVKVELSAATTLQLVVRGCEWHLVLFSIMENTLLFSGVSHALPVWSSRLYQQPCLLESVVLGQWGNRNGRKGWRRIIQQAPKWHAFSWPIHWQKFGCKSLTYMQRGWKTQLIVEKELPINFHAMKNSLW